MNFFWPRAVDLRLLKRLTIGLSLVAVIGCSDRPNVFTESSDARLQRLVAERGQLQTTTDPVDRARIQIRISDLLISFVGDAADIGDVELIDARIQEYRAAILDARDTMLRSGRNPLENANGYRDVEIAIRQHIRQLDDIGSVLSVERRQPVDHLIEEVTEIRDEMLDLLFPDENAV